MKFNAYPFLVSRNRMNDYHTVVQPDFYSGNKDFLSLLDEEQPTPPGKAKICHIIGYTAVPLWAIYRTVIARGKFIGLDSSVAEKPLLESGREIRWTEGVVFEGPSLMPDKSKIREDLFLEIRNSISKYELLEEFWNSSSLSPRRLRSECFQIDVGDGDTSLISRSDLRLHSTSLPTAPIKHQSWWRKIISIAIVLLFLGVVIAWYILPRDRLLLALIALRYPSDKICSIRPNAEICRSERRHGICEGHAHAILIIINARGIKINEQYRNRLRRCEDDSWVENQLQDLIVPKAQPNFDRKEPPEQMQRSGPLQ